MSKFRLAAPIALVSAVAGCMTPNQFLDSVQPMAIQTTVARAQYEMDCPNVTPTVQTRLLAQPRPSLQGAWIAGVPRGEFTIGISGCGQRGVFSAVCPQGGDGCVAVGNPNIVRE